MKVCGMAGRKAQAQGPFSIFVSCPPVRWMLVWSSGIYLVMTAAEVWRIRFRVGGVMRGSTTRCRCNWTVTLRKHSSPHNVVCIRIPSVVVSSSSIVFSHTFIPSSYPMTGHVARTAVLLPLSLREGCAVHRAEELPQQVFPEPARNTWG